jgi:hypothetical protein
VLRDIDPMDDASGLDYRNASGVEFEQRIDARFALGRARWACARGRLAGFLSVTFTFTFR